ncbi:MAG: GGDEF domain-containing protein [Fibrobacter sp.]|nr:GGDEF domain-containing protein [Fibrobacter sp.]
MSSVDISRAIATLAQTYYKVLKVNLTDDTYEVAKLLHSEVEHEKTLDVKSISLWLMTFADQGNVYEADENIYRTRLTLESLRNFFKENDRFRLRYRRKTDGVFRWVFMEILKAEDYTDKNQSVWLFVQDIHDSYVHEMEVQRELEHFCKYDTLTGLNNFYSYQTLCRNYAAEHDCESIGVIFADLNGLKLINDTRGHTAGNDFLRSFTSKLVEHFKHELIYRISGDEFLIIFRNCDKEDVVFLAENFQAFLNQDPVPQAAIGCSWSRNPSHIEDVTRDAETRMYVSKEAFYKKHPEYKRGIAELAYKREIDAILKSLSNSYALMATIDLVQNSYWILKSVKKSIAPKSKTFEGIANDVLDFIDDEYKGIVSNFFDIQHLTSELKKNKSLVFEYKTVNGHWHQATFRTIDEMEGNPIKALFILEQVDHGRAARLEHVRDLQFEHQIIEGLSKNYSMICRIELGTKKVQLYKNISLIENITTAMASLDYDAVVKWFTQKYVVSEDKNRFATFMNFDNVRSRLEKTDQTSILFRTIPEFHNTKTESYSQFFFYRLKSDPDKIVLATKNVTNSMG